MTPHQIIPIKYSDKKGEIVSQMINDGSVLKVTLEGIEFVAENLDDFLPKIAAKNNPRFEFDKNGVLTNYYLFVQFPMQAQINGIEQHTTLNCKIKTTNSINRNSETIAECNINLLGEVVETGSFDYFETAFDYINKNINSNIKLNCCFNCLYSDYSVYGQGFWGTMLCFKNRKKEYLKVRDKAEYMEIMENHSQLVQETYHCKEFERRIKGTGYRG